MRLLWLIGSDMKRDKKLEKEVVGKYQCWSEKSWSTTQTYNFYYSTQK